MQVGGGGVNERVCVNERERATAPSQTLPLTPTCTFPIFSFLPRKKGNHAHSPANPAKEGNDQGGKGRRGERCDL